MYPFERLKWVLASKNSRLTMVKESAHKKWLVTVATKSKNAHVRREAVRKLTDQALLAKIAVEDEKL
jgi:hypothetical protein